MIAMPEAKALCQSTIAQMEADNERRGKAFRSA